MGMQMTIGKVVWSAIEVGIGIAIGSSLGILAAFWLVWVGSYFWTKWFDPYFFKYTIYRWPWPFGITEDGVYRPRH